MNKEKISTTRNRKRNESIFITPLTENCSFPLLFLFEKEISKVLNLCVGVVYVKAQEYRCLCS